MNKLTQNTSIVDILGWQLSGAEPTFSIPKSASFEPGAQGVGIAALRAVSDINKKLFVSCDFREPEDADDLRQTIFDTPFGFSLARLATSITFEGGQRCSEGFKPLLASTYKQLGGCFGIGKQKSLICADPYFSLPPRLQLAEKDFPPPSAFIRELGLLSRSMGFEGIFETNTESPLISFIYEAFRNTQEHGIPETGRSGRSTRALILEKIVVQGDLESRSLSPFLRNYLLRIYQDSKFDLGLGAICVTIVDQGAGINDTLPRASDTEGKEEQFARAFLEGESRKPQGAVKRGLGLPNVLSAAFKLDGMIQIYSGDLCCAIDYSIGEQKYPQIHAPDVKPTGFRTRLGTAISLFVPSFADNVDQVGLFDQK